MNDNLKALIGCLVLLVAIIGGIIYYNWPTNNIPVNNDPAVEPLPEMLKENTLYNSTTETDWRYIKSDSLRAIKLVKSKLYILGETHAYKDYTKRMRYVSVYGLSDDLKNKWPVVDRETDALVAVKRSMFRPGYIIKVFKERMPSIDSESRKSSIHNYCPVVEIIINDKVPDDEFTIKARNIDE